MTDHLSKWLQTLGLGEYAEVFEQHRVIFEDLTELSDADLEKIGVPLGPRKRILKAVSALSSHSPDSTALAEQAGSPDAAWRPGSGIPVNGAR